MCLGAYSATVLLLLLFRRPAADRRGVRQPLRHVVRAGGPAQPHSGSPGRSRAQVSRRPVRVYAQFITHTTCKVHTNWHTVPLLVWSLLTVYTVLSSCRWIELQLLLPLVVKLGYRRDHHSSSSSSSSSSSNNSSGSSDNSSR